MKHLEHGLMGFRREMADVHRGPHKHHAKTVDIGAVDRTTRALFGAMYAGVPTTIRCAWSLSLSRAGPGRSR